MGKEAQLVGPLQNDNVEPFGEKLLGFKTGFRLKSGAFQSIWPHSAHIAHL